MDSSEINAYNTFLQTGRIADYLNYVDAKQPTQIHSAAQGVSATGENGAYYDRRDRAAGIRGG